MREGVKERGERGREIERGRERGIETRGSITISDCILPYKHINDKYFNELLHKGG